MPPTTSALSQHTTRLRFLVAFRPGITNPTLAAQQATTFQRMTNGRLLINIVTGAAPPDSRVAARRARRCSIGDDAPVRDRVDTAVRPIVQDVTSQLARELGTTPADALVVTTLPGAAPACARIVWDGRRHR